MSEIELLTREVQSLRETVHELLRQEGTRIDAAAMCSRFNVTRQTLHRWRKETGFPAMQRDGAWLLADVKDWERKR